MYLNTADMDMIIGSLRLYRHELEKCTDPKDAEIVRNEKWYCALLIEQLKGEYKKQIKGEAPEPLKIGEKVCNNC